MDDDLDEKDDTKRKSRNLSEKKRRDQFNMLINELNSMVSNTSRKMDKSTVLKSAISFLRNQNEISVRSRVHEIQEDWKPSFLTNEEFTHIILESIDGFIVVFSLAGQIMYTSGSVTSLLGYLPSDLMNGQMSLLELVCEADHKLIYDVLANCGNGNYGKNNQVEISLRMRRGPPDPTSEPIYELVHLVGYFRGEKEASDPPDNAVSSTNLTVHDSGLVFVGTGRLIQSYPIGEVTFACDSSRSEFTSRHNLDWKFLALDARATTIIGYVQIEVVGTSGYDYYHVDDLDNIISCHEALMEKGEGTSCYYRFLTKGQQWVWLQTRYYISYHQWNAKPEFVVCSHRVISYVDVMLEARKGPRECEDSQDDLSDVTHSLHDGHSRSKMRRDPMPDMSSDSASLSEDSHFTRTTISSLGRPSRRVLRTPRSHMARRCAPSPSSTVESRHGPVQYLKAVPLQPLLASPVSHSQLVAQSAPLTDEVKKKQQELDQLRLLMSQKEEELQQFVNAQSRYHFVPSLLHQVSVGYPGVSGITEDGVSPGPQPPRPIPAPVTQEYLVQSTSSADPPISQGIVHNLNCDDVSHSYDDPTRHSF